MRNPTRRHKYQTWLPEPKKRKTKVEKEEDKYVSEQKKRNEKFDF